MVVQPDAMTGGGLLSEELTAQLAGVLEEHEARGQTVDVSANRTAIEVSGPSARAVLEKGCRMDLHPRAFPVDHTVSTNYGVEQVLLWRTGEQTWRIMPPASFAEHTARWFLDGMTEFGSQEVARWTRAPRRRQFPYARATTTWSSAYPARRPRASSTR